MGCGNSREVSPADRDITNKLRQERRRLAKEIKLLLLGAGESGKSTIAKQMKIIHLNGFTEEELMAYKPVLQSNTIEAMKLLVLAASDLGVQLKNPDNKSCADKFESINTIETALDETLKEDIKSLWADEGIQAVYERRSEFQLPDSAKYVFEHVDRIAAPDFLPDTEDVLRCRARTTGIHETEFDVGKMRFRMVDVGGQRSERKKWVHCFQDVTAIIFCVAMNEYDMKLYEDENVNRMHEAIQLFDEICNSKWFQHTSMVLFLNKRDLFQEKIRKVDLNVCFPEYTLGKDYHSGSLFIEQKFKELNKQQGKQVYCHITCATDTNNIRFVFNAAKDIILNNNLLSAGFG